MAYNEKILKYAKKRDNFGSLDDTNDVGIGYVGNAACGDMLKVYIKVNDHGLIEDVKVKSYGCGCAIASTALAAEKLIGRTIEQALQLTDKELADELELPGIKKHCSVLAQAAVKQAVENYKTKKGEYEIEISKSALKEQLADSAGCCDTTSDDDTGCCSNKSSNKSSDQFSIQDSFPKNNALPKMNELAITPAAQARFLQIVKMYPEAIGVIIASQAGGCAGNSYNLDIAYEQPENSKVYDLGDFKIFVPKVALMYVLGTTIDYQETETKAGFVFQNPGLKTCGCGESFK